MIYRPGGRQGPTAGDRRYGVGGHALPEQKSTRGGRVLYVAMRAERRAVSCCANKVLKGCMGGVSPHGAYHPCLLKESKRVRTCLPGTRAVLTDAGGVPEAAGGGAAPLPLCSAVCVER